MQPIGEIKTIVDLFERSAAVHASQELFGTKIGDFWVFATYEQVKKSVDDCRGGLASLGTRKGDRVAIIANNRIEWAVAAYATYGLGAVFVPMYESQLERDWEHIVRDSAAKVLIVAGPAIYQKVRAFVSAVPTLKHVVVLSSEPGALTYHALLALGAERPAPLSPVEPEDMASLLYTSGTTGDPKGVMLSHRNVVSNVLAVHDCFPIDQNDRSLAFLPWAHAFGHTAELHEFVLLGASIAICENSEKILPSLLEVRPTILLAVPRVFHRIYAAVEKQIQGLPKPLQLLFRRGLALSIRKRRGEALGRVDRATLALVDKVIFSRIRARFGGRLRFAISGSAALSGEVADLVEGLGITVYEGYGLTETSPIVAANMPGHTRVGTVGRAIRGVNVRVEPSGEIVVSGPNVMKGYLNLAAETEAVLGRDGSFRTGDLGSLDADGYLSITGRLKEQYKLQNGRYVAPGPLEEALKLSPFVENVMIYGENRQHNVALVVPDWTTLADWAHAHGIHDLTKDDLVRDERARAKIAEELLRCSRGFKTYERVVRFVLLAESFTVENDMLTQSLKIKRRNVLAKWKAEVERLYE